MIDFKKFSPVTREESFGKILNYAKKQAFNPCNYVSGDSRRRCAVGVLLPKELIRDIKASDLNNAGVDMLCSTYGDKAIKRVTGMTPGELVRLQDMNDDGERKSLLQYCRNELAKIGRRKAKKAGAA